MKTTGKSSVTTALFALLAICICVSQDAIGAPPDPGALNFRAQSELWRDVRKHPGGYLEISGSTAQVNMVRTFLEISTKTEPRTDIRRPVQCQLVGYQRVTSLVEFQGRETTIFSRRDSYGMLTVWELNQEQQVVPAVRDFLNVSVRGLEGTLSFIRPKLKNMRGLWKLTWLARRTNMELYVEDRILDSGEPELHPAEILSLAENLNCK